MNYFEHIGVLGVELETLDDYIERMHDKPGLYGQGRRRKYYFPTNQASTPPKPYKKLTWEELGLKKPPPDYEYPV